MEVVEVEGNRRSSGRMSVVFVKSFEFMHALAKVVNDYCA